MTDCRYVSLADWKGGKSTGYYEPASDTIFILKGSDCEDYTVLHEKIHAARRNKLTFKLGSIVAVPLNNVCLLAVLFASCLVLPLLGLGFGYFYAVLLGCHWREERLADLGAKKILGAGKVEK